MRPPPIEAAAAFGIAYRPMTDADLPFVERLYASTRAEEMAAAGWPEAMQTAFLGQQHRAQHQHYRTAYPDTQWLIVERAGAPVGRLYLSEAEGGLLLLDISLLPGERGAGLGGAMLRDVIADAAAAGRKLSLHVERSNPARRLYERLGFVIADDDVVYLRMEWRKEG
jgi:ribosomal protein S18 acetylase RimI-like enzyme